MPSEQMHQEFDSTDNERFDMQHVITYLNPTINKACDVLWCSRNISDVRVRFIKEFDVHYREEQDVLMLHQTDLGKTVR